MAGERQTDTDYVRPLRRIFMGVLVVALLAVFLVWRIDSPRIERFRMAVIDTVVPSFDWALAPLTQVTALLDDFRSYARIMEQNQQLRRELQQMRAWRESGVATGTAQRRIAGPEPSAAGPATDACDRRCHGR